LSLWATLAVWPITLHSLTLLGLTGVELGQTALASLVERWRQGLLAELLEVEHGDAGGLAGSVRPAVAASAWPSG
jgi:hypothetical protein